MTEIDLYKFTFRIEGASNVWSHQEGRWNTELGEDIDIFEDLELTLVDGLRKFSDGLASALKKRQGGVVDLVVWRITETADEEVWLEREFEDAPNVENVVKLAIAGMRPKFPSHTVRISIGDYREGKLFRP